MSLGISELVDTFCDAIEVGEKIGTAFADGVQWTDGFTILGEAAQIEEIVKDAPQAWAELQDLSPAEAAVVETKVSQRLGNTTNVREKINGAINLLQRTYVLFSDYGLYLKSFQKDAA